MGITGGEPAAEEASSKGARGIGIEVGIRGVGWGTSDSASVERTACRICEIIPRIEANCALQAYRFFLFLGFSCGAIIAFFTRDECLAAASALINRA